VALWSWINYPLKCTINMLTSLSLSSCVISLLSWQLSDGISEPAIIHASLQDRESFFISVIGYESLLVYSYRRHNRGTLRTFKSVYISYETLLPYPIKKIKSYIIPLCFANLSFSYVFLLLITLLTNAVFICVRRKIM